MRKEFVKEVKGKKMNFVVEVENTEAYLTVEGLFEERLVNVIHTQNGFGVRVYSPELRKIIDGRSDMTIIMHPSIKEIKKAIETAKEAKEQERKEKIEDIKNGKIKIKLSYRQGTPLSGYYVEDDEAEALLEDLGAGRYIEGWGFKVSSEVVKELGTEFAYEALKELVTPKKTIDEISDYMEEAKKTGKPVMFKQESVEVEEKDNSFVLLQYFVLPDGTTRIKEIRTF